MRNYIILNNKNSQEIRGLIIQELPSISKPLRKTIIEEIDGKDGDIITDLGFSAYDKTLQIGLSYNYDIDEVINFFDSKGKVTFSNEMDKYYNYQIIEQIDFERLLRFRTAIVVMHVQPFKYSCVESKKEYSITTENSIDIKNYGNYISKPIITITGNGTINLYLNGIQLFVIELNQNDNVITIDTNLLEAYNPISKELMNRSVIGNYDNFGLNVGKNVISWSGNISKIELENYSRWI